MVIQSKKIWIGKSFENAQIEIENDRIRSVLPYNDKPADIDYDDLRIVPGFIDVHTHGAYNFDTNDADREGLLNWVRRIPEEGVTSFLPTTVTQMPDVLKRAVANVADTASEDPKGAEILGIHFEGPYLDQRYKGAQPPEAICEASVEEFKSYQEAAKGMIKYITLAPEHDKDFALTEYCRDNGVVVSMGHSAASYDLALDAVRHGASTVTHLFNGMEPFHHRDPGLVGAALLCDDISAEIIGDGHHCHPAALKLCYRMKGPDHVMLITDSLCAKHCPPGNGYFLGGHPVEIKDGLAYLEGTDTIAGSTLCINDGLRILIEEAGIPFDEALDSCTINPARCLGVDDRKGRLSPGYDADIVVLEDDYRVREAFCRGEAML